MATTVVVAAALKSMGMSNEAAMGTAVTIEVLSTLGLIVLAHSYTQQWSSKHSTSPPLDPLHRWLLGLGVLCAILAYGKQ